MPTLLLARLFIQRLSSKGIIMRSSLRQTVLATTVIFGLGALAAAASPAGASDPTTVHHPSSSASSPAQAGAGHNQEGTIEQRVADLRAKLQITPAQSGQWEQFAQVMRDNARSIDEAFDHRVQALPGMTAPANLQSYASVAAEHAQEVQKLVPAFQVLYDTMSDSQKQRADQVFREDSSHRESARHN